MANRRTFMGQCAKGAAGIAVSGLVSSRRVLGANDRIRFGLIGCGSRGKEIFQAAMRCPNAEAVAAADVYTRRLDEVKALAPADQDLQGLPAIARRQERRRRPDRHAAAPARPELRARHPGRQGRLPGKDDGVQSRSRQAHAEGARRIGTRGPGRHPDDQRARASRWCASARRRSAWASITAIHTHHYRNAPYGGWMREIPAGLRREPRRLERVPGRSRAACPSIRSAT